MRKIALTVALAACTMFAADASAQEEFVGRDILEISVYGGLAVPTGGITDWQTGFTSPETVNRGAETGYDLAIDIGYYVNYHLNVGLNFRYTEFGIEGDLTQDHAHRLYNPNLYVKYSFEGESFWVPFIKGHVGVENPKFSTKVFDKNGSEFKFRELSYSPVLAFGATAGLFYYTADFSGIFLEAGYHYAMTENSWGEYQGEDHAFRENLGTFTINLGVKLIVGSGE